VEARGKQNKTKQKNHESKRETTREVDGERGKKDKKG
jgi:hypothetical protein